MLSRRHSHSNGLTRGCPPVTGCGCHGKPSLDTDARISVATGSLPGEEGTKARRADFAPRLLAVLEETPPLRKYCRVRSLFGDQSLRCASSHSSAGHTVESSCATTVEVRSMPGAATGTTDAMCMPAVEERSRITLTATQLQRPRPRGGPPYGDLPRSDHQGRSLPQPR